MRIEPSVPEDVLARVRAPFEAFGAKRVDAPLLQPLNLLLDLAGEAMRARLFVVQAEGGTESCLRPDFTVAIAQQHIAAARSDGRYLYQGPAFRAAAGTDRPEEFVQVGLEVFGENGPAADAQIASLAWQSAQAGGRQDLSLWLGDVALFAAFIATLEMPPALAARLRRVAGRPRLLAAELDRVDQSAPQGEGVLAGLLTGLSEAQSAALLQEVWALAGVEPVGGRGAAEIAARLIRKAEAASAPALTRAQADAIGAFMSIDATPRSAFAEVRSLAGRNADKLKSVLAAWDQRLTALVRTVPEAVMHFTPALGHAFDYYDGVTFEVRSAALGTGLPVAVGGRYDGLLTRLGASGAPHAVGCMVRPWRAWAGGQS